MYTTDPDADDPLLSVDELQKYYDDTQPLIDRVLRREKQAVRAVDGISFDVQRGETLGLVGESGCGKSTTGETVLRLREATGGSVSFDGQNIFELSGTDLTEFRQRAGIVFQDPFSSLDPRMTVGEIIAEPLVVHGIGKPGEDESDGRSKGERRSDYVGDLLDRVGLSASQRDRYPHEFSGGQRQRIGIARALALEPDFIVLDEPVSALDVSVQAQILNLLRDLQDDLGLTYLFIAHDLSVVRHISDRVAVMYLGKIVEIGSADNIFEEPKHPYTKALLESVPRADVAEHGREVDALAGDVPSPRNPPSGCRFHTRCPSVIPNPDIDIDQQAYREIMEYRERLETGELNLEEVRDRAEEREGTRSDDAVIAELWTETFDHEPDGKNYETVEHSFELLSNDERDQAIEVLRERFESVCETRKPVLSSDEHPAACHLFEQPAEGTAKAPLADGSGRTE